MVELKIKVTFIEEVLGSKNADPDIYSTYIAGQLEDQEKLKEELKAVEREETDEDAVPAQERSITVFPRDENGNPIVFDYQWKGYFKDAFGALKRVPGSEAGKIKAYKKEVDGLIFPQPRKIPIQMAGEMTLCQRPLRAQTMQGERVALACSEAIPAGSTMVFSILLLVDSHEKAVMEALNYGRLKGFGQWRNSGKGRFIYELLERTVS